MQIGNIKTIEVFTAVEFKEAIEWFFEKISIQQRLIQQHNYYLDHKHWDDQNIAKCIDCCENSIDYLSRLYLISLLAQVSDYLPQLIDKNIQFKLLCFSSLDSEISKLIRSKEKSNNTNQFRNSFSEHLSFWVMVASILKTHKDFLLSMTKPNLLPVDHGPDGLACIVENGQTTVKISSVKNSINSPKDMVVSAEFLRNKETNPSKIIDEFFSFQKFNHGFERLDEKLNYLLLELKQNSYEQLRQVVLHSKSQFNATVVGNEEYISDDFYSGFLSVSKDAKRCIGVYIGSENWKQFAEKVQSRVLEILNEKGVSF